MRTGHRFADAPNKSRITIVLDCFDLCVFVRRPRDVVRVIVKKDCSLDAFTEDTNVRRRYLRYLIMANNILERALPIISSALNQ